MAERQEHGFVYEQSIIKKYNLKPSIHYIHKDDGYKNDIPVQIKCIKHKSSIDLGDLWRNGNKSESFYLIIGFWKGKKDNIIEEHILFIDHKKWNKYFEFDHNDEIKHLIKTISNDYSDDDKWKKEVKRLKGLWNTTDRVIQPRFKRDHKKQKRIQCAISNKIFYSFFVKEFTWQNTENTFLINSTPNQK